MEKVCLVMDKPKECDTCLVARLLNGKLTCSPGRRVIEDTQSIPDWCPLRPIQGPKEESEEPKGIIDFFHAGFNL